MRRSWRKIFYQCFVLIFVSLFILFGCKGGAKEEQKDVIKVGILHSLSGTMSISETSLKDAELMAIDEINSKGGVLGKKIVP
ncbi:transporter substrate-binding protein, partial [Thermodesulfovibrio yellowstonii]|uniref:transporter substrate-binding protein n=1 Tax=Thermodesulfovibrio yellowstonii TaxID=28262 RepID=UPI003C7B7F39